MPSAKFKRFILAVGLILVSYVFGVPLWASTLGMSTAAIWRLGGVRFLKRLLRDIRLLYIAFSIEIASQNQSKKKVIFSDLFEQTVCKHPDKVAIIFEEESWTFQHLDEYANRIANYFLGQGLKKGDVVALFMENCPEYVGTWLGLSKIGVVSAFVNYNLREQSLVHSIKVADACAIIFSSTMSGAIGDVMSKLDAKSLSYGCYTIKGDSYLPQTKNMQVELLSSTPSPPPPLNNKSFEDRLCLIYTSGTTGLPKAVVIKHRRFYGTSWGQGHCFGVKSDDILYCTLPLYHSAGGMLVVGTMLLRGCTLVLKRKFSATNFWTDCRKHSCTVFYYVGELCRYLLAHSPASVDTDHCIRLAIGNGLRPKIWREFKTRFNIAQIGEFYGATEGITNLVNVFDKEGSVGVVPILSQLTRIVAFLKVDPETNEYIRDQNGFCVEATYNEPAEIVGKIDEAKPLRRFDGYNDQQATNKKIMRDVFEKGDVYFLSGDILRIDEDGYVYFSDRVGDTFRWKGENVSTTEVESIMMKVLEHRDVCVYGVEVPGCEGKAGMATVTGDLAALDVSTLAQKLFSVLPPYAVPVFIRLTPTIDMTGTYKIQKNRFRNEGFNIHTVGDPLYILEHAERKYVPLDSHHFGQIVDGVYRL